MKLKINKDKCIGCGQCVSLCEDVFDFDDDNLAKVIETPVAEEHEEESNTALESCPTDPIVKEEVTMIKKIKEGETFYSGSFNFSKKDFDEDDDDEKLFEEKSHNGIKIFFLIFGLLVLGAALYFIITRYVL